MVDAWPVALPQDLQVSGFSDGFGDGRIRNKPDRGPALVRRGSSATPRPLKGMMWMTYDQIDDLRTFVETTLVGGSLAFTFPDPFGGSDLLVRFGDELPSVSAVAGLLFSVSLNLEVLP